MKKGFLSIAVLAASLFSFSALAQSQQASPECTTQQCPAKPEACPRNAKACPAQRPCADPFAGINLTQDQQTKLNTLREKRKAECAAVNKSRKDRFQQRDSMVRVSKKQHLEEVKSILTPDQYVIFLENMVISNPGHDRGMAPHKMHAKRVDKRLDKKGDMKANVKRAEKSAATAQK